MDPRTIRMLEERRSGTDTAAKPAQAPSSSGARAAAWAQKHRTTVGAVAGGLLAVVLIGNYALVTLPARKHEQSVQQAQADEQAAQTREDGLSACLADAEKTHGDELDQACRASRQRLADCSLPRATQEGIDRKRLDARIDCFRQFGSR